MKAGEPVITIARGVHGQPDRFDRLLALGVIRPPEEEGDPLEGCPVVRLRDRGEA